MTDYINPHKIYPDDINRRIDTPPGFDSREGEEGEEGEEGAKEESK